MTDFVEVTELSGEQVSQEQVQRACVRYGWAAQYCTGKDVLEVACGSGPGLGILLAKARSLVAGDISEKILQRARKHYGTRVDLRVLDAQELPFEAASLDVIILFEALYYIPSVDRFLAECKRVLRPGGVLLISNANKDLSDFNPSPHSYQYHGVVEMSDLIRTHGFGVEIFGDVPIAKVSPRQRILRPIKKVAVGLGLIPKTMAGKRLLKRLVFGKMTLFPAEIAWEMIPSKLDLAELDASVPDKRHKVILCAARI
jgi:SAM-dependent methyltransferase